MRTVLSVMAGLLCALAGLRHASSLQGDAKRMRRWCSLLRHLALILREESVSLPQALCCIADGTLAPDKQLRALAQGMQHQPLTPIADIFAAQCPPCPEQHALQRMFTRLGRGTLESRVLAVEQTGEEMALLTQEAAQRADRDARLWQTLGWVGGACLTILLL
ncbi:MAG: hypothetical protein IJ438_03325 [Clostridia bacterium]|nr:hypothetical protein [Clostridia bacterium]